MAEDSSRKTFIIGLDCLDPDLIFNRWRAELPTISRLIDNGFSAPMRSSDPPITVPAWAVMMSGQHPGKLGIYGFRNRKHTDYRPLEVATADDVKAPRLWDWMTKYNRHSVVVGVPPTYPAKPLKGYLTSGMLSPDVGRPATFPPTLQGFLGREAPGYMADIPNFRNRNKEELLNDIYGMTRARLQWIDFLMQHRPWDLFVFVEMGVDRIQHGFWQFMAQDSPFYIEDRRFRDVILNYYKFLDAELGKRLQRLEKNTDIWLVSDHGVKTNHGGVAVNEWLRQRGYLVLKEAPAAQVRLQKDMVDWTQTRAWAEGGYYSRIFLNLEDRETHGIVNTVEKEVLLDALQRELKMIRRRNGDAMQTRVFRPQALYDTLNGMPPDLFVYFDDLNYRALATVGVPEIVSETNDAGSDGANHDYHGVCIANGEGIAHENGAEAHILDVAPTILERMGIPPQMHMDGKPLFD